MFTDTHIQTPLYLFWNLGRPPPITITTAPHMLLTPVEDRCFEDHLPTLAPWMRSLLCLLSHLQLQSCHLTYKDCLHLTCFASRIHLPLPRLLTSLCLPFSGSVIQCYTSTSCLAYLPSISPTVWPFNSVPWQSPSWGVPCHLVRVIMTVIMNVRRQRQTVGIY